MDFYTSDGVLYHHGIKNQKWGVKHGPPYPLSEKKSNKNGEKKKSKHRLNLEEKYQANGMTKSEAEKAANKRINAEKVVAAVAATAVVAGVVAYAVYRKNGKKYSDKIIKEGSNLQRMSLLSNVDESDITNKNKSKILDKTFYASNKKLDNEKYKGWFSMELLRRSGEDSFPADGPTKVYKLNLSTTKDMKVASQTKASEIFKDLYNNDSDFRSSINKDVFAKSGNDTWVSKSVRSAVGAATDDTRITSKKDVSNFYKVFNASLDQHSSSNLNTSHNKFYSKLVSEGYDAINDLVDMKAYGASNPLIVFNTEPIAIETISKMSGKEISKSIDFANAVTTGKTLGETAAVVSSEIAVGKTIYKHNKNKN